jgi:hypothetical protein
MPWAPVVIALMMVMICADVISRGVFQKPIAGVSELTAMAIVVIVFLSLGSTLRHGRMSRADLFIDGFITRQPVAGRIPRRGLPSRRRRGLRHHRMGDLAVPAARLGAQRLRGHRGRLHRANLATPSCRDRRNGRCRIAVSRAPR